MTADSGHDAATGIDVRGLRPIARPESVTLARVETERMVALLRTLGPDDWARPTDCPAWDVRATAGHMLGMVQMIASTPEMIRQQLGAKRRANRDGTQSLTALDRPGRSLR